MYFKMLYFVVRGFRACSRGRLARRFSKDCPDISIVLDIGDSDEVVRKLSENESDIGFVLTPPHDLRIVSALE